MSTSIIKSLPLTGSRVRLGTAPSEPASANGGGASAAHDMENRLRAELSQHFEAQLAQARQAAREEGYQDGYKEGLTSGHAEGVQAGKDMLSKQLALLETLLKQADEAIDGFWAGTEGAAADLAFEAVCQLMGEHALDATVVAGMVRQLMRRLHDSDLLHVRLHPSECAALVKALNSGDQALQLQMGRLAERLREDPTLESGGCVIETPRGDYCASLDVQLTRLRRALQHRRDSSIEPGLSAGVACA